MSTTVDIPGGTATLRDELKQRQRREVETATMACASVFAKLETAGFDITEHDSAALAGVQITRAEWAAMLELQDAVILACLESWTLKQPLPTFETIGDLNTDVYDALKEATASRGARVAAVNFDPSPDPGSPTQGSTAFAGGSKDDEESPSETATETSTSGGESTDTAPYTLA